MRRFLLVLFFSTTSCSLALKYDECKVDTDCGGRVMDGGTGYCTSDHFCVDALPEARLCTDTIGSSDPDAVVIAGLFNLFDQQGFNDNAARDAMKLGVEEVNLQGKRPIRAVICDTAGSPAQAKRAFIRAAKVYGAVAIVGLTSSSEVVALTETSDNLLSTYPLLVVSPAATSAAITDLADSGLVWRTAASDNLQAKVLATLVPSTTTRVSLAYVKTLYGSGLNDSILGELSGKVTGVRSQGFDSGSPANVVTDFLTAGTPEVATIIGDYDVPAWVAAIPGVGAALSTTQILLTDGAKGSTLFGDPVLPSQLLDRIRGTAPATPLPSTPSGKAFDVFRTKYMGRYNSDPAGTAFVANAYDAFYVVALSIALVPPGQKATGPLIAQGMSRLSSGNPVDVGASSYASAFQSLASGASINLNGTSGPIDFDANGDIVSAPIEVWAIDTTNAAAPSFKTLMNVTP